MNFLDRFVGYLSPSSGLSRVRARQAMQLVNSYDGAAGGRRTINWLARNTSANTEIQTGLVPLRQRHRELVRNNPWATRAVQAIVANTVGHGITGEMSGNKGLQNRWLKWSESSVCDADGCHDLLGMQALVMRAVVESGDCIVRARPRRPTDGFDTPLQIQVLEGDYLDHQKTYALNNGGRIVQGVQFNAIGQREGYWLFKGHPGDSTTSGEGSVFVPANRVAHIYRVDRPGQVRGVPWGAPVMTTLRDLDDYEDAYLFRQKLANCITGFVHDHSPDLSSTASGLPMPETLEPGLIAGLPAGKSITFNDPPRVDGYGAYTRDVLLRVAAGYGITFQALTGDLSSVNFSSGRMGWIEMSRNIDQWRWHMLIPQLLERVEGWFLEAAELAGDRITGKERVEWTPPRRLMLDPTKETAAAIAALDARITSLPEIHRELGVHTENVFREIAETNKLAERLNISLAGEKPKPEETEEDDDE